MARQGGVKRAAGEKTAARKPKAPPKPKSPTAPAQRASAQRKVFLMVPADVVDEAMVLAQKWSTEGPAYELGAEVDHRTVLRVACIRGMQGLTAPAALVSPGAGAGNAVVSKGTTPASERPAQAAQAAQAATAPPAAPPGADVDLDAQLTLPPSASKWKPISAETPDLKYAAACGYYEGKDWNCFLVKAPLPDNKARLTYVFWAETLRLQQGAALWGGLPAGSRDVPAIPSISAIDLGEYGVAHVINSDEVVAVAKG